MKNIIGQPARNGDFFRRDKLISKIYRRLDARDHVFLAAPRRVGKTSIMLYLAKSPKPNYHFVFIDVESVYDIEMFYYKLWDSLAQNDFQSYIEKASQKTKTFFTNALNRIKGVGIPVIGGKIDLNDAEKSTYQQEFEQLLRSLKLDENEKLVFMIDEFPQAVENIKNRHGKEVAKQFLHLCREQRQSSETNMLFMYTGSIGLPAVVRSITSTKVINDLSIVEVTPLSASEAKELTQLILNNYQVEYNPTAIDYLIEKIQWLIPFHIQLAAQELIDIYESEEREIIHADIDQAFDQLLKVRNNQYFEHYYGRLKEAFPNDSVFTQIILLLNHIAIHDHINKSEAYDLIGKKLVDDDYERVIESLQFDGYIYYSDEQNHYAFASQLIKMWWKKFIVK